MAAMKIKQRINRYKSWYIGKINKIGTPLAQLAKNKRKPKLTELDMKNGRSPQTPVNFRIL